MLLLKQQALQMNIELDGDALSQFASFKNELLQWNANINLISENSAREIVCRHFLDSLTALPFIQNSTATIMDIGCGAGFPGLPLKIALPSLTLYLLEANRKKVSFLKHIIRLLKMSDVFVVHNRVEHVVTEASFQARFDIVISRAAFKLSDLQSFCNVLLHANGRLIAWKGSDVDQEIQQCLEKKQDSKISHYFQYDIKAGFSKKQEKLLSENHKKSSKIIFLC